MKIELELNEKEYKVLAELAEKQGLSIEKTLIQALRCYQLMLNPPPKLEFYRGKQG